jgi:magnesium-transporting ATPase (P-type)
MARAASRPGGDASAPAAAPGAPVVHWHTLDAEAAARALDTSVAGLPAAEAAARLERYGPNEIEAERETPWWRLLLHQFQDPLIYILLIAAAVTFALRDYADTGVILAVVLLNAAIGFVQEVRAQRAMRSLASMSAPRAEVLRDGHAREIPSRDLVPGDVVMLSSGARVPADLRLVQIRDLEVDESALTGESLAVRKRPEPLESTTLVPGDQLNLAFAGTTVTRGRGTGIVVRTGAATELGRIATAVREVGHTTTPLQEKMHRFGRVVGVVIVALSLLVAGVGLLQGMTAEEIFLAAVALAVASIPEGLPVVLTVTLAIGVNRMARRRAIIRSLPAVETLGSTTVIGSDKTGTLTKNEMTVTTVWAGGRRYEVSGVGYAFEGAIHADGDALDPSDDDEPLRLTLLAGALANEADGDAMAEGDLLGDPTELALLVSAAKGGMDPRHLRRTHPELDILPFEPERRFMATLNSGPDGRRLYLKGAPEVILERCDRQLGPGGLEPVAPEAVRAAAGALAAQGLRVLAMAYRPGDLDRITEQATGEGLVLAGLQGMVDPVRPEAVEAVASAQQAGIRVLMITGDHADTARAIGRQLGLDRAGAGALEGRVLETLSDDELDRRVREVDVYARVAPEHKLRIVQRLKAQGEVVAVTGDGVNDAPALRAAHLGIAMGKGGTDVAREASDMVLVDDNFASITAAVEEGRVVFSNIRKVTFFLLSTAVGQIITILVAVALGWPLPMLAAQILWINLVTNGLQDVALAFEPGEPGLLRRRPRPAREGIVTWRILERLGGVGLVIAVGTLGIFWWSLESTGDLDFARTMAMTQMVVFQFFHVFNSRSLDRSILSIPLFSNRFLFASIVAAALAHLAVLHLGFLQRIFRTTPLALEEWGLILLVGSSIVLGGEMDKWRNRRKERLLG